LTRPGLGMLIVLGVLIVEKTYQKEVYIFMQNGLWIIQAQYVHIHFQQVDTVL